MMATVEQPHVEISTELSGGEDAEDDQSADQEEEGDSDEGSGGGGGGSSDGGEEEEGDSGESDDAEDNDGGEDASSEESDDAEDGDGGEADGEEGGESSNPNAGWAEAMAKILGKKTPASQPSILLKNKQLDKKKDKEKKELVEKKKQTDKKRAWESMAREKPDVGKDREAERNLQRIATRGVVQLFNAVRKHQTNMDEKVKEVGSSERKKAKLLNSVSKRDFIDVLRGTDGGSKATVKMEKQTSAVDEEADEKPAWSVLRDDFMMGASMKDWDKESDGDEGEQPDDTQEATEDSDSD